MKLRSPIMVISKCLVSMLCLSCSHQSPIQSQYAIEKDLFRAEKAAAVVLLNPRIAPASAFDEAIQYYRRVVAAIDSTGFNLYLRGLMQRSLSRTAYLEALRGNVEAARTLYQDILHRFQPDEEVSIAARLALGILHERRFEFRDAIANYAALVADLPDLVKPERPAPALLGLPLKLVRMRSYAQGHDESRKTFSEAKRVYRKIIARWPESRAALQATGYLAALLAEERRWDELEKLINTQLEMFPDSSTRPTLLFARANLLYRAKGQRQPALAIYHDLLAQYPNHEVAPLVQLELARIKLEQGRCENARQLYKSILEQYANKYNLAAAAQEGIAYSYELENRWEQAINEYRWLIKSYEVSQAALAAPIKIIEYYRKQNERLLVQQAYRKAIEYYTALTVKYPKSLVAAIAQEQLANVHMLLNQWDNAVAAAQRINKIMENNVGEISTYLLLGKIYESSKQTQLAVKAYSEIIERYPQHPLAEALQAKIRAWTSDAF